MPKDGKGRKTSGDTSGKAVVGYGGNNNLTPGNPGNKGGGRRPHKVREIARASFAARIHILEEIADEEEERSTDRIAALKLLSDTGGVDKIALTLEEQPEQEMTMSAWPKCGSGFSASSPSRSWRDCWWEQPKSRRLHRETKGNRAIPACAYRPTLGC